MGAGFAALARHQRGASTVHSTSRAASLAIDQSKDLLAHSTVSSAAGYTQADMQPVVRPMALTPWQWCCWCVACVMCTLQVGGT